ncbi:MAG: DUF3875 domain-containing protein [Bacteroides uniformis]|nr:DUF3875 domain-containing protein [Bacteroides uniformis]
MRNTSKMTTLENKFPLLAVEHGCIISKDADITVAFEVELPELYTVTGAGTRRYTAAGARQSRCCRTTPSSTNRTGSSRNATSRNFRRTT